MYGASGHAHPSPSFAQQPTVNDVRHLFAELNICIRLRGLLGADRCRVTDIYCPEVRRSPLPSDRDFDHLDVISCWKGLALRQASELAYWEDNFASCLEVMVTDVIIHNFARFLKQQDGMRHSPSIRLDVNPGVEPANKWTIIPNVVSFLTARNDRLIDITVPDLVANMIKAFYNDGSNQRFAWFTSTRDLPAMVFNFVRTRDCFRDSFPYPTLEIKFSHEQSALGLSIFGDISWQTPSIQFFNVPSELPSGAEYRITALYTEPNLRSNFISFPAEPEYIVSSKRMPLAWDSSKYCFRAIVPDEKTASASESKSGKKIETMFSAKIVTYFPDEVRFERTSRYNIKLGIKPKRHGTQKKPSKWFDSDMGLSPEPIDIVLPSELATSDHTFHFDDAQWAETVQVDSRLPSYSTTPVAQNGLQSFHRGLFMTSTPLSDSSLRNRANLSMLDNKPLPRSSFFDECTSQSDDLEEHPLLVNSPNLGFGRENTGISEVDPDDRQQTPFSEAESFDTHEGWQLLTALGKRVDNYIKSRKEVLRGSGSDSVSKTTLKTSPQSSPGEEDVLNFTDTLRSQLPRKRKATKQISIPSVYRVPSVYQAQRLAFEIFESNVAEVKAKRQRMDERLDSGFSPRVEQNEIQDDSLVAGLANFTTGRLGQAYGTHLGPVVVSNWKANVKPRKSGSRALSNLHSRAYKAVLAGSKVMPALKKRGGIKRMVFKHKNAKALLGFSESPPDGPMNRSSESPLQRPVTEESPKILSPKDNAKCNTPSTGSSDSLLMFHKPSQSNGEFYVDAAMSEIQQNYAHFLKEKQNKTRDEVDIILGGECNDEEKAMERVFILGSESSEVEVRSDIGWGSDSDTEHSC